MKAPSERVAYGLPLSDLKRILAVLAQEPAIRRVILFGSRAKWNFRNGSDIDLCLEAPALDPGKVSRLASDLDDLLLPWKIDLILRHEIQHPGLVDHIQRVGIPLVIGMAAAQ
ncbi:nucleotidyltransferase family protein [Dechloromonas sp.]|uniref:nucleotidyltransferase family protein n=1 Tax=Dechloromonas sp. TaxID=1917218 RepID=UPI00216F82B7|nr:nucleotidyltransferase domain-containing protein [Dechloromonas sp.]MBU3698073.1 nucleotidyltransferase domain-containing protein [Dechloromonas sp.]